MAPRKDMGPLPSRKISETILDFGEPLFAALGDEPPIEVMRNAVMIVVTVWNAHVFAAAGKREYLDALGDTVYGSAPPELMDVLDALSVRRLERFADDPRLVGEWDIVPDGRGGHVLQCDARLAQDA